MTFRPGTAVLPITFAKRLAALFILLAFAFQGLALATHIHPLPVASGPTVVQATAPGAPLDPQNPTEPDHCALCQQILHSGAFVTPDMVMVLALLTWAHFIQPALSRPSAASADRLGWQSRAPPL